MAEVNHFDSIGTFQEPLITKIKFINEVVFASMNAF